VTLDSTDNSTDNRPFQAEQHARTASRQPPRCADPNNRAGAPLAAWPGLDHLADPYAPSGLPGDADEMAVTDETALVSVSNTVASASR
jgi:hypothetical protein